MSTITENLDTIKTNINRMKTALGLENDASLETVTKAVESIETGGGSNTPSNIYKVDTIEQRNALKDVPENALCVVLKSISEGLKKGQSFSMVTFPMTVVLPSAITEQMYFDAMDPNSGDFMSFEIDGTYCTIYSGSAHILYRSKDGITYTRENDGFGNPINLGGTYTFNSYDEVIKYFIIISEITFDGIFTYKNSNWENTDIGIYTNSTAVLKDNTAYTSGGIITGEIGTANKVNETIDVIDNLAQNLGSLTANKTSIGPIYNNKNPLPSVEYLDTSNITDMTYMFMNTEFTRTPNLSNFNTSKVETMRSMFFQSTIKKIDLSMFDTSKVTNLAEMFNYCSRLIDLDVSNWNTSNVTHMGYMFCQAGDAAPEKTTVIKGLNTWNTSNVVDMEETFGSVTYIKELDLSSWTTTKVTSMSYMFYACSSLKRLDIRNFTFDSVTNYNMMFGAQGASYSRTHIPSDCLIIVKDDAAKNWITSKWSYLTNIKTVAELA